MAVIFFCTAVMVLILLKTADEIFQRRELMKAINRRDYKLTRAGRMATTRTKEACRILDIPNQYDKERGEVK